MDNNLISKDNLSNNLQNSSSRVISDNSVDIKTKSPSKNKLKNKRKAIVC